MDRIKREHMEADEELVSLNEGCFECEFSGTLTKEESMGPECDDTTFDQVRAAVVERVHQARATVATQQGATYDRRDFQR